MITVQLDINAYQVETAMVDTALVDPEALNDLILAVFERIGDPKLVKSLIGKLGDAYTYLEETFGNGAE